MRAYLDSNIYISYLLGQRREELIERMLKRGIECAFAIVASPTVFAEVGMICQGRGDLLLRKTLDDCRKAGKLSLVYKDDELRIKALELDKKLQLGLNDSVHVLLAAECADVFVTEDRALRREACPLVRTVSLPEFASEVL